jgi:hypothetical protein
MKKVRKFQTGGVSNPSFREEKQKEIENKKIEREAKAQAQKEATAQRAYKNAVANYERELKLDPQDTNPFGYKMRKFEDKIGDKVRSIGKNVFGTNQMTSMDDEAQMQARKDVKGYKKGGMAHSDIAKDKPMMKQVAAKAVKGHEKRMHSMAKGGKVGQLSKADGCATKGKSKGTMVKMKHGGAC